MIPKYLATLAATVFVVTVAASEMQFSTRSQVLSGEGRNETPHFEFTIDAANNEYYKVSPAIRQFLEGRIGFHTEGTAHVISSNAEITPKDVSWTSSHVTYTAPGAAMTAQIHWDTPADSANGAHSSIYLDFPEIPGLEGKTPTFRSGGYQQDDSGRVVIREVTTYRTPLLLALARFVFALSAGLPFGIVLHTIFWAFELKAEKRSRIGKLPPRGSGLPQTFYPNPVAEWHVWLLVTGIGAVMASMMAGFSVYDGFLSSSFASVLYIILAAVAAIAFTVVYFNAKSLLTVRIDADGISWARGRGDLEWHRASWSDIALFTQKSRTCRGNTTYWIELKFNGDRKKLKIGQSIEGYPALRDTLRSVIPT